MSKQIIYNAIKTPDGTLLVSRSVHDYRTHKDANGKTYMIDGGREYIRCSYHGDEEHLTLYTDDDHSKIREVFTWRTYGKDGDKPLTYVPLSDLSSEHISNIKLNCSHIPDYIRELFTNEQKYRNN